MKQGEGKVLIRKGFIKETDENGGSSPKHREQDKEGESTLHI